MPNAADIVKHLIHHPVTGLVGGLLGALIALTLFGPGPMPPIGTSAKGWSDAASTAMLIGAAAGAAIAAWGYETVTGKDSEGI